MTAAEVAADEAVEKMFDRRPELRALSGWVRDEMKEFCKDIIVLEIERFMPELSGEFAAEA